MISRDGLMRLGLIVFVLSVLFGATTHFFPAGLGMDSKSGKVKGDLGMAYATCVAENDLPGDYRSYSTLKTLQELSPKERAVVFGCAAEFQMLAMVRWVLADKSLPITVNPDFRGRWPVEKIASWNNGKEAVEALDIVFESEGKNLFFSPFTAQEQSVVAAYNTTTAEVARFLAEKWPDLINKESARLGTLEHSPEFSNLTLAQYHALMGRFEVAQSFAERGSKVAKARKSLRHEIFLKKREFLLDDRLDRFLHAHGVAIDERDETNKTLLHYAVELNDERLVNHLLSQNAHTEVQDNSGATPLHYAASKGNTALLSLLLAKTTMQDTRNFSGRTPLHEAIYYGSWEAANLLLDKGARLDVRDTLGRTPIFDCMRHGCPFLDRAITAGADINVVDMEGNSLLHLIAQSNAGNAELIDRLIARGFQVNIVNKSGRIPLHQIAEADDVGAASALLKYGSNPNQRDRMGNTPLHLAKTKEMVATLLEAGANPDIANKSGEIPLNSNIAHTQMLFHSPSHINVKTDTLIRYFSNILIEEKPIEMTTPTHGVYAIIMSDELSGAIKLVARRFGQEYKVEATCQISVKLISNDNSLSLRPTIVSDWAPLPRANTESDEFSLQDASGKCKLTNYPSANVVEALLLEGKEEFAKWEASAKQCDDVSTINCMIFAAPMLKVSIKKGEAWKELGVITPQQTQLNIEMQTGND